MTRAPLITSGHTSASFCDLSSFLNSILGGFWSLLTEGYRRDRRVCPFAVHIREHHLYLNALTHRKNAYSIFFVLFK